MTKSLLAIGGLGVAGCVLLSLMMQQLVDTHHEQKASPLDRHLSGLPTVQRCGSVRSVFEGEPGQRRLVLRCRVHGRAEQPQLAKSLGREAWRRLIGTPDEPREVVVQVVSADDGQLFAMAVPRRDAGR